MDGALIVGTIMMCAAAAVTATLFALVVHALPTAAFKAFLFVATTLIAATFVSSRLRRRLADEGQDETTWFTALVFSTQFFLALAWAALVVAIVVMLRT